jgi:WD40 repeat protein
LIKVDADGNEVWSRTWEEGTIGAHGLVQTADGDYLITGSYSSADEADPNEDFLFIKIDPEGNELWTSTFGDPDMIDYGMVLAETTDGGYVAAGERVTDLYTWDADISLVKIDGDGQLLWEQIIETDAHCMFGTILQHPDGGYVVAGSIFNGRTFDIFVLKADAQDNVTKTSEPAADAPNAGPEQAVISPETADQIELLHIIEGHDDRIYGLDFSSDGMLLASGSYDDTIRLWEVESWQQTGILDQFGAWTVFFAPDDAHVATENGTILNIASGEKVRSLDAHQSHVTFSPDGAWMASAGHNSLIDIWDVETWQVVQTLEGHTDRVFGLAFSPDGALLASGSGMGPSDVSDYVVKVWDISSGNEVHTLEGHSGDIHAVAFSPDGTLVASASTDYTVRLWDVQSGELIRTLRHGNGLYDVTFSPDGTLVASAGCDRTVKLWDVASGKQLHSLRHGDEVMAVAFSPDGSLLASGGYDNQVYLWSVSH